LEYHIISTLCSEEANTSFHLSLRMMHPTHGIFHTFTCAQRQAQPTQQIFFLTALHRRIISTLCTEENSKPITWAPSPLTGVHDIPSPSERGTTHPTHGHTQLMGFLTPHRGTQCSFSVSERNHTLNSWAHPTHGLSLRPTYSVCVLEDVSHNCNQQLRREVHLRRGSLVDSRRNTLVVDFGVERHTLITGEVTQIFHLSSVAVSQVATAKAHSFRVRAQLLRRFNGSTCPFQGEFKDSLPT
jgi:hypothetical protein